MNPSAISTSPEEFVDHLRLLSVARQTRKESLRATNPPRQILSAAERREIFAKTSGRCHICGGTIEGAWHADHVLAHSGGGEHCVDNYLPAHALCNSYRWDYSSEEFQHILKLGVWIRTQIERRSRIGQSAAKQFVSYEVARVKRRRSPSKLDTNPNSAETVKGAAEARNEPSDCTHG